RAVGEGCPKKAVEAPAEEAGLPCRGQQEAGAAKVAVVAVIEAVTECDGFSGGADPKQEESHRSHAAEDPDDAGANAYPESPHVERPASRERREPWPPCRSNHHPHNTTGWTVFLAPSCDRRH